MTVEYQAYFVADRPQVTWAWDLADRNLRFLSGIDPQYFNHIAQTQGALLDGDSRQYAAAALRVSYSQGLETLVALISAAMQAPLCVVGWMLAYKPDELCAVVDGLVSGEPVEVDPSVTSPSLESLATSVMNAAQWEQEKRDRHAARLARLWRRWASEFLDERATSEYNSFKHGMRASLGGFTLSIGEETAYGVPAAPETMVPLGGSAFGSTFYCAENIDGRLHQYPRRTSRNWSPLAMAHGLQLLTMSIENVVSYLRILGGDDPRGCRFSGPADDDTYDLPWQSPVGITFSNLDLVVRRDQIEPLTKSEVLTVLKGSRGSGTAAEP